MSEFHTQFQSFEPKTPKYFGLYYFLTTVRVPLRLLYTKKKPPQNRSRDGVSIGAVVGIFFALGFVIVVAVVVGVVLYWYKFKRGVKAGPSNADLTLTDEEGCSVTGSGGGGGGTIRHSKGNSGDVRHGSGSRGDSRRGGSEGSSRGVGGGGKGGKGSKGSSGKDKDKTESPPAQELVTVEDVVPNVQE